MDIRNGVIASPPLHGSRGLGNLDSGNTPLVLAAGLMAALVGGGIWAGIAVWFNLEIGWAAWGIGLLVGLAMSLMTERRGRRLALAAASLAVLGLFLGKAFAFSGSTGAITEEFRDNPEYMAGLVAWQMYEDGSLSPRTMEGLEATQMAGDTLSDALWATMVQEATTHMATLAPAELEALAASTAGNTVQSMGMLGGVLVQLSLWDALWLFLAVGTAYSIMNAEGAALENEEELALAPVEGPA